jgi:hypothetical protein
MAGLATVHARRGDFDAARQRYDRVIAIWEKAHGPKHPFLVLMLSDTAQEVELPRNRPREARILLERALATANLEQMDPRDRGALRSSLARALWESGGDRSRARALARAAREDFAAAGKRSADDADKVAAWLAAHPAP